MSDNGGSHENANLNEIYNRLHNMDRYHPYSAETFGDWSVEGGDVISIAKDGEQYRVPVNESTLTWRGQPQLELNATGNEERAAISKISKNKYNSGGGGLRNADKLYTFQVNQEHLLYDVYDESGMLHGCLEMTSSKLKVAFQGLYDGLGSRLEMTRSSLQIEFWGLYDGLGTRRDYTRSHLQVEFWGLYDGLSSTMELTRSHLEVEFRGFYDGLNSRLEMTRSMLIVRFDGMYDGLSSTIIQTRSEITTIVSDSYSNLMSHITQTSSRIISMVSDSYNKLSAYVDITSSSIRSVVNDNYNKLKSGIVQTASSITSTVEDNYNKLKSGIIQTASSITSTVEDNYRKLSSGIVQTASSITATVQNNYTGLQSQIQQTASSIELKVADSYRGLSSEIKTTNSAISLTVKKGEVVSAINQTAEQIKIQASKIDLEGTVVATDLTTLKGQVSDLTAGVLEASGLKTRGLNITSTGFALNNQLVTWQEQSVVTRVAVTEERWVVIRVGGASGVEGTTKAHLVQSVTNSTLYYLGKGGS